MALTYYKYSVKRGVQKIKTRTAIALSAVGISLGSLVSVLIMSLAPAVAATPVSYFNGFETDTTGWNNVTRTASGTNGVTSASGSWHAVAADTSAFTRWGGYSDTFPTGGYTTSTDIYLNTAGGYNNDTRFDWDNAVNDPSNNFRRDFVFNCGYYNDSDSTGTVPRFVCSASNNATRGSSFPKNPGRSPFPITDTGWYTFKTRFYDNGSNVLAADLSIVNSSGTTLSTWTLSDSTDVIGSTVGGNRYGWFPTEEFTSLAIDNTKLLVPVTATGSITAPTAGQHVSGTLNLAATYDDGDVPNTDDAVQWAVRAGTCAAGTGTVFGNVDGHQDTSSWDGKSFSASLNVKNVAPGSYCFVFNPTDDPGQPNVRETQTFFIDAFYPQSKSDCMNGGWANLHDSNDTAFKNQGLCVAWANHHDANGQDGDHAHNR